MIWLAPFQTIMLSYLNFLFCLFHLMLVTFYLLVKNLFAEEIFAKFMHIEKPIIL